MYDLTMTVHDDDNASGADSISLVVHDQDTKVTGGGFIKPETGRTSFGFVAHDTQGAPGGQIQIRLPNKSRFHGSTVTALTVSGKTASWSGTGTLNREGGYTYAVTVTDNRNGPGKGTPDTIALTITDANGRAVTSVSGPLAGGNITVHK